MSRRPPERPRLMIEVPPEVVDLAMTLRDIGQRFAAGAAQIRRSLSDAKRLADDTAAQVRPGRSRKRGPGTDPASGA